MKARKPLARLAALALTLAALPAPWALADPAVSLSAQKLTVDGKSVECEKYNIDGANYFKLRDLAFLLNGTESHFTVSWNEEAGAVEILTGWDYGPVGGELDLSGGDRSATARPSAQKIIIDYREITDLSVYNIGGNNFFKLRDLGAALGFSVDYDAAANTAIIRSAASAQKSPEQQIEIFLSQKDLWYHGDPEYYPAYRYYAVTDLNQNGRLEIISSEFRYDTNISINRFYEINEAQTGVTELDYDLKNNGETELAPGLVNADLPAMCFFQNGEYYYSLPTPGTPNENLEIEYFFMLGMDWKGSVSTELLGEKWVSHTTDTTTYLRGLEVISETEYYAADLKRYDGYDCCQVDWDWVMLLEGWDDAVMREELVSSWENFNFDTLGLLS